MEASSGTNIGSDPFDGPDEDELFDLLANDTTGNSTNISTTSASWVDSFYATMAYPAVDTKALTLLTESPINVGSSPTVSVTSGSDVSQPAAIATCASQTSNLSVNSRPSLTEVMAQRETRDPQQSQPRQQRSGSDSRITLSKFSQASSPAHGDRIYCVLREGLLKYIEDEDLQNQTTKAPGIARSDFLTAYCQQSGFSVNTGTINKYIRSIRSDELQVDEKLLAEIRVLLLQTDPKGRRFRTIAPSAVPQCHTGVFDSHAPERVVSGSPQALKIGFSRQDGGSYYFSDLNHIVPVIEDSSYLTSLHNKNTMLATCLDAMYPGGLMAYPLTYMRIPLSLQRSQSVDLDTDRMVSYAEVVVDTTKNSPTEYGDYLNCVPLKSITRAYTDGMTLMQHTDPATGFQVASGQSEQRVMLPLQAGLWARLINELHNGIIEDSKFQSLIITQVLMTENNAPVHSFIWDFTTTSEFHFEPRSVIVQPGLASSPSSSRLAVFDPRLSGHKRTRSRSLSELELIPPTRSLSLRSIPPPMRQQQQQQPQPPRVRHTKYRQIQPAMSNNNQLQDRRSFNRSNSQPVLFRVRQTNSVPAPNFVTPPATATSPLPPQNISFRVSTPTDSTPDYKFCYYTPK